jgi:EmrB/QacA subfamily drug resistance transporter
MPGYRSGRVRADAALNRSRGTDDSCKMPPVQISSRRRWAITAGVMTGMFLAALEATIIGTAMPTVVAALGGLAHFSWVFSAYLLTSTVSVPIWGKLSDLYGRRIFYQIAIAIFMIGSVLSGMSQSMPQLIAARALQGLGAGGLVPLGMTIIGDIFTLEERARMQGLFSGVWGLSSVVGPLIGGFITDQFSWRWVFYINVPFGIAAAVIIGSALIDAKPATRPKIDYLGAVVLTVAVTLLMLALVEGGTMATLFSAQNIAIFIAVVAMLAWFIRIEQKAAEPIIPLGMFRNRVVALSMIIGFLAGVAMFGAISFVPLFAQGARGASATAAGSTLTPLMLAWVSASIVGGRLLIRVGSRPLVIGGHIALIIGFAGLTVATRETPMALLMAELAMIGVGLGLVMLTLLIAVQHAVPRHQLGIATSLNQFFRSIGGAMGVALLGAVLTSGLAMRLDRAASAPNASLTRAQAAQLSENPSALVSPEAQAAIPSGALVQLQQSLAGAMRSVFAASGIMCVLSLGFAFMLPAGRVTTEHAPPKPLMQEDGETFVMAEMTMMDAEHEPESSP